MTAYDDRLSYPSYDKPFLQSWEGLFEAVFVLLHPFFRVPGLDPVRGGWIVSSFANSAEGAAAYENAAQAQNPDPEPAVEILLKGSTLRASIGTPEGEELTGAVIVPWSEVAAGAGLAGPEQVYLALQGIIGGVRAEFYEDAWPERLIAYCEREQVFMPTQGEFQEAQAPALARLFLVSGPATLNVQQEFDTDRCWSAHISNPAQLRDQMPYRGSVYDPVQGVLAVVDWDSHFTLVAGPKSLLEPWALESGVDGFFANKRTQHSWWLKADPQETSEVS